MTLLDRYLHAVTEALPKDVAADDVIAEIDDDLRSRIEERETQLGRSLIDAEISDLLRAYGHPRVVAARYGRVQYLIGPDLLPFYWSTLQLVMALVIAAELLAGGISAVVSRDGLRFFDALGAAWNSAIWIFGIVTVVYAASERMPRWREGIAAIMRWDPLALPERGALAPVRRSSALAEFIANTLALLALLDAPGPHRVPLDQIFAAMLRDLNLTLTPAWHPALVGTTIGTALLALSSIAVFVRPSLARMHEAVRAISSVATIVGLVLTIASGQLFDPAGGLANVAAPVLIGAAIVILAVQSIVSTRRLFARRASAMLHEAAQ